MHCYHLGGTGRMVVHVIFWGNILLGSQLRMGGAAGAGAVPITL